MTMQLMDAFGVTPELGNLVWDWAEALARHTDVLASPVVRRVQPLVELRGGEIGGFDLAHQRHRDMTGQIDLVIPCKVLRLENLDADRVHRGDAVIRSERRNRRSIGVTKRNVVRDRSAGRVRARSYEKRSRGGHQLKNL